MLKELYKLLDNHAKMEEIKLECQATQDELCRKSNKPADDPFIIETMQPIIANLESTLHDTSSTPELLRDFQQQRVAHNADLKLKMAAILK